ncbi:MAG TPA: DUF4179 domain-containing protein [Ktedonobacterales bacterium]|nr:DUF4179 domain-containing protein [Ktedonobacterales bacterium]
MQDKEPLFARYPDLLDEQADPETQALIQQLAAAYATREPPAYLTLAGALELRARQPQPGRAARQKPPVRLARWLLEPRPLPQRIATIAIALILALTVAVGSTYAVGTILDRVLNFEPGTAQIAVQNLYQPINQSQTIQGFTVTAAQGYADSNRIIVAYMVKKPAGHIYNHVSPLGQVLTTQNGLALPYYSGNGYGNRAGDDAYTTFFDAAGITGNPHEVHLHLEVQGLDVAQQDGNDATLRTYQIPGVLSFDFSLTFHPGRIANVHQIVTVGGTAVTLERVVVTLSETRVYLQGLDGQAALAPRLSVDGWDSDHSPVGPIGSFNEQSAASGAQAVIFFSVSLYEKHGTWTLTVQVAGGSGPWTFHFVVP